MLAHRPVGSAPGNLSAGARGRDKGHHLCYEKSMTPRPPTIQPDDGSMLTPDVTPSALAPEPGTTGEPAERQASWPTSRRARRRPPRRPGRPLHPGAALHAALRPGVHPSHRPRDPARFPAEPGGARRCASAASPSRSGPASSCSACSACSDRGLVPVGPRRDMAVARAGEHGDGEAKAGGPAAAGGAGDPGGRAGGARRPRSANRPAAAGRDQGAEPDQAALRRHRPRCSAPRRSWSSSPTSCWRSVTSSSRSW